MTDDRGRPLAFDRIEGAIHHRFLRHDPVAAHVALSSGPLPRIVIAFPAGNRGVLLAGATHPAPIDVGFGGAIVALDPEIDGIRGVLVPIVVSAPEVRFTTAIVGDIRTIRDVGYGVKPNARLSRYAMVVTGTKDNRALAIERGDIGGRHVHAISIEPRDGSDVTVEADGTIVLTAGPGGVVHADLVAMCDAPPLTPIPLTALLRDEFNAGTHAGTGRDLESLAFLAYREKLLAGSWQYLTYFGRDTLLSLRLLAAVASPELFEAGLGAVLDRLSPAGDVAHEETLGEYGLLDRERRRRAQRRRLDQPDHARDWRIGRDAAVLDDKMVDDDFLLAPLIDIYLHDIASPTRAEAFLAAGAGHRRGAIRANLALVTSRARPYAATGSTDDLIHLKPGSAVGNWRDSHDGLGGGVIPFDVNCALVPASLLAASRIWESPHVGADDAAARDARALAAEWTDVRRHFDIEFDGPTARAAVEAFVADRGLPTLTAEATSLATSFPAIALDATGAPVPIMHSDDSLVLLFTDPPPTVLDGIATRLLLPFPAGLRLPGAGIAVANPAYADLSIRGRFTSGHYHGTVVWSWPLAAYAIGLARQLVRTDLPTHIRMRLVEAQAALWEEIDAVDMMRSTEFWTFRVIDGRYVPVPAQGADIVNESNPAQLWSASWLGVERPRLKT